MRNALPRRHPQQPATPRNRPREQFPKHIHRPPGFGQRAAQAVQRLHLAGAQIVDPCVQTAERFVVRRQHQHIVWHGGADLVERGQPVGHRVGVGLGGEHGYVGRDARQHLVAGYQQLQCGAVQAGMFGGVAGADDDLPVVGADADGIAVGQPAEALGQGMHVLAEAAEAGAVHLDRLVIPAGLAIERDGVVRRGAAGVGGEHAAHQVFEPGHPELAVELAGEPSGHADVVRMHMRHEQAGQAAFQRAATGKQRAPGLRGFRGLQAGIDRGPAAAVADGPQVDMVEPQRHRHAQPQYAGCDFPRTTRFGGIAAGVVEFGLFDGDGGSCERDVGRLGGHRCLGRWAGRAVRRGGGQRCPGPAAFWIADTLAQMGDSCYAPPPRVPSLATPIS
ncbi:hypothetical protein CUTA107171_26345 [Cupriavidus taiwanensis]